MHYWDDKDGSGNKLTDGRICLVTKPDDPEQPEIRTYGKDKDEVISKLATTVETGQSTIHRLRKTPPASSSAPSGAPAPRPAAPAAGAPSTDVAKAVADLSNPALAPAAVKTLLRVGGFDADRASQVQAARRIADIAESWENEHPEYPKDPRNDQILMNRAALLAGGNLRITAEIIQAAFEECTRQEMFFEPKAAQSVQPEGTPESRTVRHASTYRKNALRSPEPGAVPQRESANEAKWRKILDDGTGQDMDNAIRAEKAGNRDFQGFQDFANKLMARAS